MQEIVTGDDEQKALCTDDFSDISPLTGGNVAFSTLEGRPGAYNFDRSPVLQVFQCFLKLFVAYYSWKIFVIEVQNLKNT